MKTSFAKQLALFFIFTLVVGFSLPVSAEEVHTIRLPEALKLVFIQNTNHVLFLWEQELSEKREALKNHPQITAEIKPLTAKDGILEGPEGSLKARIDLPLNDNLSLNSNLDLNLDTTGFNIKPSANLTLDYDFFALPEKPESVDTAEAKLRREINDLVSQTIVFFFQLQEKLEEVEIVEKRYNYLKELVEAAERTPDYDDLKLKEDLRAIEREFASLTHDLAQLQVDFVSFLGVDAEINYIPEFELRDFALDLNEEELLSELYSVNQGFRQAQAQFDLAQKKLSMEQKTGGWNLKASGGIHLGADSTKPTSSGPSWNTGLVASKLLYPHKIVLDELEFGVAQAKQTLKTQEKSLQAELRRALQSVQSAQEQVELSQKQLQEAQVDWDYRQREYQAGLITEFQLRDARLSFREAELMKTKRERGYSQSILNLWHLLERELDVLVSQLIS